MPLNSPIRLSLSEAAKIFGVSSKTIRRAINDKEIGYVVVRGRYRVNFDNLLKWSQKRPTVKNKLAKEGIGQFVDKWKISAPLYSPNPERISTGEEAKE
ncbi:MAG: helix-turn-helix domain-containing protein [Patescibacteria group bacterium]|jgi:excisionase family DNA binding protein